MDPIWLRLGDGVIYTWFGLRDVYNLGHGGEQLMWFLGSCFSYDVS